MRLQIRHKLFFTLLFTSGVIAAGLFFFLQWSFDRGFLNYVKSQEVEQLDQLASRLTSRYVETGSWNFLENNHALWIRLVTEVDPMLRRLHNNRPLPLPPESGGAKPPPPGDRLDTRSPPRPPHEDSRIFGPRVLLLDHGKKWIIGGPPGNGADPALRPIVHKGAVIGYLGLLPLAELSYGGDLLFIEQQKETFALVTLTMVVFSLLLAYPLTSHLLRPIKALAAGTNSLIAGLFRTRIPVVSGDELGRLSEHFNILAMTLEKNTQARQQWVADISHELRTPLSVVRGDVEAMLDGVRKMDRKNLEGLHGEIMHLERLVGDLYELSMSDIGALTYRKMIVNPVGILQGAIENFEPRFATKDLTVKTTFPEDGAGVMLGDPDRLQQLFSNLLENSLRYSDGSGLLEIEVVMGREQMQVIFQDSGPGVPDEHLPRLFERLYRVDSSRSRSNGGVGLGLAICRNIVEAHQGRIAAQHAPYGGLAVVIELPLHS